MKRLVFLFVWALQLSDACCRALSPSQHVLAKDVASTPVTLDRLKGSFHQLEEGNLGNAGVVLPQEGDLPRAFFSLEDLKMSWKPPLSTRGRYIVDADGNRFRMKAGNWHGASGTYLGRGDISDRHNHHSGEQAFQTPLCLDRTPLEEIVQSFLDLGINTVRLPFSNEMLHSTEVPPDSALRANPQLRGLTPLEIYDACIVALTKRGIAVILNNHTTKSRWCCGPDINARWNSAQSDEQWQEDWIFLVRRYKGNPRVVAAELYNEVRRDLLQDPKWGGGGSTDWFLASQDAGSRIQREANADILIIIEGINYVGLPTPYTKHWRPELQPVRQLSHTLPVPDKLVYSAHFYSYTGPNATGGPQAGTHDPFYRDLSLEELEETVNALAFFVATPLTERQQHYTNPVLISEFGSGGRNDYLAKDRTWWTHFISLLVKYDIDFAVWPLVGWQERAKGDLWALNSWDANGNLLSIASPGDWRLDSYKTLIEATGKTGQVELVPQYRLLHSRHGSMHMSNKLQDKALLQQQQEDRSSSAQHLYCPDGLRVGGFSHHQDRSVSVSCTDAFFGREDWHLREEEAYEVVSERSEIAPHRAFGYQQMMCNSDQHMVGLTWSESGELYSITCVRSSSVNSSAAVAYTRKRLVRLRPSGPSHDLAADRTYQPEPSVMEGDTEREAHCADDERLVGLAISTHRPQHPIAVFCQSSISQTIALSTRRSPLRALFKTFLWTLASKIPFVSEMSLVYLAASAY